MKAALNLYKTKLVKKLFGSAYKAQDIKPEKKKTKTLSNENYLSSGERAIERWETDGGSIGKEVRDELFK